MSFAASFREGREAARAARGAPPQRPGLPPAAPAPGTSSPIKLGYHCDLNGEKVGAPLLSNTERHFVLFGLNGAGKSTRFLIELLATASYRSLLVFDIKGELAYQTAAIRRLYSDVKIVNPFGVLGMPSDGYNPLSVLDPKSPKFYDAAASIGDALIEIESGSGQYWSESAQGLLVALIMYEVIMARRETRPPSLFNVRRMLTEADAYAPGDFAPQAPDQGFERHRRPHDRLRQRQNRQPRRPLRASSTGSERIGRDSVYRLDPNRVDAERCDAKGHGKTGHGFSAVTATATTIYVVMDPEEISKKRRWTRVVVASALSAHFTPGPLNTLFVLDEFRAAVGKMQIISDMWSLVRGYGVQLMPILQSALQLQGLV